jgi:hypothetical protein
MSKSDTSAWDQADVGLGAVERLVKLLKPVVGVAIPDFRAAARGFESICKRLLDANENLTRWISRFRDFDFTQPKAHKKFIRLAGEYRALKTGRRYEELKFDCGEIESIFLSEVRGKLKDVFGGKKLIEAQAVFDRLTHADAELVLFVHSVIFESLDKVCDRVERSLENDDLDKAEAARLRFKVDSGPMMRRLEEAGSDLADLVLQFKRIASGRRPSNMRLQPTAADALMSRRG